MKSEENILGFIGNTPLIKLRRITEGLNVEVYVKCEYFNPSGSIKDRIALRMIEEAETERKLKSGDTIIEMTSGNTGPALALVGSVKGYRVRIFIPAYWTGTYSPEDRVRIMKLFGAEVEPLNLSVYEETLGRMGEKEKNAAVIALGMKKCYELEKDDSGFYWPNQMCNIHNVKAHCETTGKEIIEQLEGEIDGWVASIGTGGTLFGVADTLKMENPSIKVIGVEPMDASMTMWTKSGTFEKLFDMFGIPKMKLLTYTMIENDIPDSIVEVTDDDARKMAYRLCKEEGFFCGISSGANVHAAIETAKNLGRNTRVVTVLVDRRDRYFSEYPNEKYVI